MEDEEWTLEEWDAWEAKQIPVMERKIEALQSLIDLLESLDRKDDDLTTSENRI